MDKLKLPQIIELLKEGYKICIDDSSMDCVKMAPSTSFVGSKCKLCHSMNRKRYSLNYNKNLKQSINKCYGSQKLKKASETDEEGYDEFNDASNSDDQSD